MKKSIKVSSTISDERMVMWPTEMIIRFIVLKMLAINIVNCVVLYATSKLFIDRKTSLKF